MRTEDGHIIRQCLEGKPASFGLLVDKYKASILAIAYAELHNMQDAEEVAQDAFLQAYKKLNTLRRWDSFLSWICAITYNLCKRRLNSQSKRPDSEFIEDQDPEIIERPSIDSYYMDKSNESLDDTIDMINKALDSLPKKYSQVLTLHYLGGMGVREMSQVLSISPDNIKQRLSRARAKLREEVLTMMNTTFEQQKLQASFTFNIVEMVKQVKIHTIPSISWISWGFSVGVGLIFTVMSFFPNFVSNIPIGTHIGSPLPSESRVLKIGEIPVDVMKTAEMTFISNLSGKGKDGGPKMSDMQNAFFMAPQAEGGEWKQKADMPTTRATFGADVVNGKIYAIGGWDGNALSLAIEEYDPIVDKWIEKAKMPTRRINFSISAVNGKIYLIGGNNDLANPISTVEEYDPVANEWVKKADMPTARYYLSTSVVNGKIYAIGGAQQDDKGLSTVEEYDPTANTWTKKADMLTGRDFSTTAVVNGKIYATGAFSEKNFLPTMEEYDPITDTWTKKADMLSNKYLYSISVLNGKIYVIGGTPLPFQNTVTSAVEEYDPAVDKWTKKTDMPTARNGCSSVTVGNKIYTIGGGKYVNGGNPVFLSVVEEYTPEGLSNAISPQGKLPTTWGKKKQNQ